MLSVIQLKCLKYFCFVSVASLCSIMLSVIRLLNLKMHVCSGTMKFYVVFVGHKPRVYTTWMDCHRQVSGYPNNLHASFASRNEAEQALSEYQQAQSKPNVEEKVKEVGKETTDVKINFFKC